ncbi:MAG: hypothetical protein K9N47_24670 [Prosthecobacter sp.]|uniref:hypothetical protein n=1 Tax=Prosthecobacter sp. TaxID=1965333 RepID=UPI0026235802|nr:hypothetical protein [Prosthecobacter sp.]MCF7789339.1 hypothetical protein [Prosthecobacter sp.]
MNHGGLIVLLLLMAVRACAQQEATIFQPPVPHDVQRYEAGWNKNPFTLKTVAPLVEQVSFAVDLTICTYFGDSADPTIIIANTKTNERISLKQGQPAANGMKLSSVKLGTSRKDVVAQVTLGTETAAIRYNDSYVKQMAAAETTKAPPMQQSRQQPGAGLKIPAPQIPSQPGMGTSPATAQAASPGTSPATAQAAPIIPGRPGFVPPSGKLNALNPPSFTPLVSQSAGVNGAPPVPVRRRLVGPAPNSPVISQ